MTDTGDSEPPADGFPRDEPWVSLFSGGKDSSWALYRALEAGLPVERLVTVHPEGDSYMYHTPATDLTALAAESIGIDLVNVHPDDFEAAAATDSGAQGDRELEPLERALEGLRDDLGGLGGVTAGAVESEYQTSRIRAMADRLGCDVFAPLWQEDPRELAGAMLDAGFEIRIVQVAAGGLDESWLGRPLDREALADLERLNEEYGVHLLGEGGEFETFVVDGPHMERRIDLEFERVWEGTRGHVRVTGASLE
ncbi:diphthine--ammonia ligase [Haloglomus litoreum]|uniref:diphthine--ammonia ligase n=1 Tax=Haloglomus litoreum TaxID=3034026 RepID=UPI0023E883C7|nr:diphthine--ammonia ligase [Haloglomus sp. DT116]